MNDSRGLIVAISENLRAEFPELPIVSPEPLTRIPQLPFAPDVTVVLIGNGLSELDRMWFENRARSFNVYFVTSLLEARHVIQTFME